MQTTIHSLHVACKVKSVVHGTWVIYVQLENTMYSNRNVKKFELNVIFKNLFKNRMMLLLCPLVKHSQGGICHLHSSRKQYCNLVMEFLKILFS